MGLCGTCERTQQESSEYLWKQEEGSGTGCGSEEISSHTEVFKKTSQTLVRAHAHIIVDVVTPHSAFNTQHCIALGHCVITLV